MNKTINTRPLNTSQVVLASGSPRRKDLLRDAGLVFDIRPADIDEDAVPYDGDPSAFVRTLSALKAREVSRKVPDTWVIGADTIVVADHKILGKPRDNADARAMLSHLSGRPHFVYTGYTIAKESEGTVVSEAVETRVVFKSLSPEEITWYAGTKEPYDKAGGYGIQGMGGFMVREIQGSYSNVVGLPVCEILDTMTRLNIIRY